MKKIALIEVWLGKIPDYFKYHVETLGTLKCVDFYFFTDDKNYDFSYIKHKNFILNYIDETTFLKKFNSVVPIKIDKILNPKKITDFKLVYFDIFSEYIKDYDYLGIHDIDVLFGDMNNLLLESMEKYDFISVGDEKYHNRLSGPFIAFKNTDEIRELMRSDRYYETILMDEIYGYGEKELSVIATTQYKTKIIHQINTDIDNDGKIIYDCVWSGGKLLVDNKEIYLYHFYRKNKTKFDFVGNKIITQYDKTLTDDFYWVIGFTENYSKLSYGLLDSLKKYSNRKCVIYTINFDFQLPEIYSTSNQFILRRIDIPKGNLDARGRDENIINSKPLINLDVINYLPNKTFVFLDCDIYLTVNCDELKKYFIDIESHPLINSHVHDRIYVSDIIHGEWVSTIDVLSEATGIPVTVFPRRKTNVIAFNDKSKWFFEEQMSLYNQYKNTKHGVFRLHDEDSANILLSKYNLTKSLPLIDIEESSSVNMDKIRNYSYSMSLISNNVTLPVNENDIYCFHGFKDKDYYLTINSDYGKTVLDCEDFVITYNNNTIKFEKNSFLTSKKIELEVDFIIKDINNDKVVCQLNNQSIFRYWLFYYSNIYLQKGKYQTSIVESQSKRIIFNDILEVK